MAKAPTYKPGQKAPVSGQYGVVGPRGGMTGTEVTVTKGNGRRRISKTTLLLNWAKQSGKPYIYSANIRA